MARFKKILLTGINGQVGYALYPKLASLGEIITLDRTQLDLFNPEAIRETVQAHRPDLIINPAAYTAVDKAESEPDIAYAINAIAPGILAEEAAKLGALIVHYSTDYVFDGTKKTPYIETDATNPISVYGKTKLAGEAAIGASGADHLIFRTSWVYGNHGNNFMKTILRLTTERDSLRIVSDQIGAPTSSDAIADATVSALIHWDNSKNGIYHLVNSGETSWHGFACEIVRQYNALKTDKGWPALRATIESISPITTSDYPTPAKRPANSRMDCSKLAEILKTHLPSWDTGLKSILSKR
jgi:dTDP-4-dehydrorhamnose reductase